jgi:hypothetical protein
MRVTASQVNCSKVANKLDGVPTCIHGLGTCSLSGWPGESCVPEGLRPGFGQPVSQGFSRMHAETETQPTCIRRWLNFGLRHFMIRNLTVLCVSLVARQWRVATHHVLLSSDGDQAPGQGIGCVLCQFLPHRRNVTHALLGRRTIPPCSRSWAFWPPLQYPLTNFPGLQLLNCMSKHLCSWTSNLGVTNFQATPCLLSMRSAGSCWVLVKFHGAYDYS